MFRGSLFADQDCGIDMVLGLIWTLEIPIPHINMRFPLARARKTPPSDLLGASQEGCAIVDERVSPPNDPQGEEKITRVGSGCGECG